MKPEIPKVVKILPVPMVRVEINPVKVKALVALKVKVAPNVEAKILAIQKATVTQVMLETLVTPVMEPAANQAPKVVVVLAVAAPATTLVALKARAA